jgi:hypothetical protein
MKSILGFLFFLPFWGGAFAGLQTPAPTNHEVQFELNSRRTVPHRLWCRLLRWIRWCGLPADQGLGIGFSPIHQAGQPACNFPPTMKTTKTLLAALALLIALSVQTQAATLILDSFTEGRVNLSDDNQQTDIDILSSGILRYRDIYVSGLGDYTATLVTGSGVLNYTVALRGQPLDNRMAMIYRNPDQSPFSLLGTDGFVITVTNLVGSGELVVSLDGRGGHSTIPVRLSGSGDIFYPVSNISGVYDLNQLSRVSFNFIALSPDFSITLSEVSAVPEPSATVLFSLVACAGLFRRRRL